MYAAMRTRGWQAFKTDEFKMQVQTLKENKQEKNAVQYLLGRWGRVVLSQLSAIPQMLGEKSKLKLVSVLAYTELLATVHRKEH